MNINYFKKTKYVSSNNKIEEKPITVEEILPAEEEIIEEEILDEEEDEEYSL